MFERVSITTYHVVIGCHWCRGCVMAYCCWLLVVCKTENCLCLFGCQAELRKDLDGGKMDAGHIWARVWIILDYLPSIVQPEWWGSNISARLNHPLVKWHDVAQAMFAKLMWKYLEYGTLAPETSYIQVASHGINLHKPEQSYH